MKITQVRLGRSRKKYSKPNSPKKHTPHSKNASSFIKKVTDDLNLFSITKILFRLSFDKSVHYSRFERKNQPFPRFSGTHQNKTRMM